VRKLLGGASAHHRPSVQCLVLEGESRRIPIYSDDDVVTINLVRAGFLLNHPEHVARDKGLVVGTERNALQKHSALAGIRSFHSFRASGQQNRQDQGTTKPSDIFRFHRSHPVTVFSAFANSRCCLHDYWPPTALKAASGPHLALRKSAPKTVMSPEYFLRGSLFEQEEGKTEPALA